MGRTGARWACDGGSPAVVRRRHTGCTKLDLDQSRMEKKNPSACSTIQPIRRARLHRSAPGGPSPLRGLQEAEAVHEDVDHVEINRQGCQDIVIRRTSASLNALSGGM